MMEDGEKIHHNSQKLTNYDDDEKYILSFWGGRGRNDEINK